MKVTNRFLVFTFLFVFINPIFSQTNRSWEKSASDLISKMISDKECVGIAAGFSINGQTEWSKGKGFSNKEKKIPFEANTLTRIASISKPMTAIAIMQLFEQKKLELDVPIQKYLPDFPRKKEGEITIRHLLNHSSGIGAYQSNKERENKKNYSSLEKAMKIFKDRNLLSEPGKEFNYTTYGFVVLGRIIEVVSGKTYEAYLKENIWDKAGMLNTGIEYCGETYSNKAQLYHRKKLGKFKKRKPTDLSDRVPGGGIYSTVNDLLKFGDALLGNQLIQPATLQLMLVDLKLKKEGNGYGLGWYLYGENPKYGNVFGHTGGQTGCSAMLMILPDQNTTIISLSNTSNAMKPVSYVAVELFKLSNEAKGKEN